MKAKGIFITGATGQIGKELLRHLLAHEPSAQFYVLIRANKKLSAPERYRKLLEELSGLWSTHRAIRPDRIVPVIGNLELPDLGLAPSQFRHLAGNTDTIYHLAASVALNDPLDKLRQINLMGTTSVLKLAHLARQQGGLDRMVYLSTAYVAGQRRGVILENELQTGQEFNNPYERVKLETEQLVELQKKHLPISILRPSMVVGHSQTGRTGAFNVIYGPLKLLYQGKLPLLPCTQDSIVDLVPLDYVCKAIHHIGQCEAGIGGTFHLTAGPGREFPVAELIRTARKQMLAYCSQRGIEHQIALPKFIHPAILQRVARKSNGKQAGPQLATYSRYALYVKHFDNSQTIRLLRPAGIALPEVRDYFPVICRYALEQNFGKRQLRLLAQAS